MTVENIKEIVTLVLRSAIAKKRVNQVLASMEVQDNYVIVYLSHGATLGEAQDVQEVIKKCGLKIPTQFGNAAIYVTAQHGKGEYKYVNSENRRIS